MYATTLSKWFLKFCMGTVKDSKLITMDYHYYYDVYNYASLNKYLGHTPVYCTEIPSWRL